MELYKITGALAKIEDMAEEDQSLAEFLDGIQLQMNEKIDGIVRFSRNMESDANAIEAEIQRLKDLKAYKERMSQRLKDYISHCMTNAGITKIETSIAKLSFRKSESLSVVDEAAIPDEFKNTIISKPVDKNAIKQAIKDGREVPGAKIEERQNLQIK